MLDCWQRIQDIVDSQNTTWTWIAERIGIKQQTLSQWVKKDRLPDIISAIKIARLFNMSVPYFMHGKDDKAIAPEIIEIAKKIEKLSPKEKDEIMLLLNHKLANRDEKPVFGENKTIDFVTEKAPKYKIDNNVKFFDEGEMVMIPHYGRTAASKPLEIDTNPITDQLPFPIKLLKGKPEEHLWVTIKGYSMVEAGINDGDIVLIRKAYEAINGEIMLVRFENSSTLKRILIKNGKTFLCYEDGSDKKIEVDSTEYEIQGIYTSYKISSQK
ncbi:MAG: helix-turn-helix domain-containing protein [Spirochaetaceae bacterium]|nr:helix-turn-helix domain-containing protein [Spirochaetaceae bacterium]